MKAIELIMIYNSLMKVKQTPIADFTKYRKVRKLMKAFEEEYIIYCEREQELVKQYAKLNSNGQPIINGNMPAFKSEQSERDFINAKNIINAETIELEPTQITLTEDEIRSMNLTYADIEILENVVNIDWNDEK